MPRWQLIISAAGFTYLTAILNVYADNPCLMEIGELENNRGIYQLIDVRSKITEANSGIANKLLHIPLYSLRTKKFLKNRPVVLLGNNARVTRILKECESLRKQGFEKVYVVDEHADKFYTGKNTTARNHHIVIQANEYLSEREYRNFLLLDIKNGAESLVTGEKVYAVKRSDIAAISRIATKFRKKNILLLSVPEQAYPEWLANKLPEYKIFMLNGGRQAYNQLVINQRSMQKAKYQSTARQESCNQ